MFRAHEASALAAHDDDGIHRSGLREVLRHVQEAAQTGKAQQGEECG